MLSSWDVLRDITPVKKPLHIARQILARLWLQLMPGLEVIGITGSVGKTTTKEALFSILSQKFKVVKSEANLDPIFNIPQTILKTKPNTQKLILEMGVEYPGEMDFYLSMVKPKIGIVTRIYWAHTEFFKDLNGVIEEKGKMIQSLPENGYAVLNFDDPTVHNLALKTKAKTFYFGTDPQNCQVWADKIQTTISGTKFILHSTVESTPIQLALLGKPNLECSLAAASAGIICGLNLTQIKKGLEKLQRQPGRLCPIQGPKGSIIIDDTYNASPIAVQSAIETLVNLPARRRIVVLGEMKELGDYSQTGHRNIGKIIATNKIDYLFTLGDLTKFIVDEAQKYGLDTENIFSGSSVFEISQKLSKIIKEDDLVLVKGSRFTHMERVVAKLGGKKIDCNLVNCRKYHPCQICSEAV